MFLHGGWMHLIGNMLFLWVFADNIEAVIGTFNFLIFYVAGGLVASAVHIFFNPHSDIPMVGASGAISAALGAYLVMFPASRIKVFFIVLFCVLYSRYLLFGDLDYSAISRRIGFNKFCRRRSHQCSLVGACRWICVWRFGRISYALTI